MDFGENKYRNIDLILSDNCNLNCLFCNTKKGSKYSGVVKVICSSINKFYKEGFNSITFSGGEPTLDENLFLYIAFAKKIGYKNIKVQTNLLFSEDYFLKLLKYGITGIGFTYLGLDKSIFISITGNVGKFSLYSNMLKFILNYSKKIDICVDIILNEYIIKNILNETDKLLNIGFYNLNYKFPFFTGKKELNYDLKFYSDILKECLIGKDFNFNILYIPTCYLKGLENHIYNYNYDYIYDFKYFFSLNTSIKKIFKKFDECNKCNYKNKCFGFEKNTKNIFKPLI